MKGNKFVHSPPRTRSGTNSSIQTGSSSPTCRSDELTASPKTVPQHIPAIPSEPGNKTPTGVVSDESDESEERHLARRPPSIKSLHGDRPISPVASSMPVLPSAASAITTDDSDTDFQSAYSRHSRGSTGSLGSRSSRHWSSEIGDSNTSLLEPPAIDDFKYTTPDYSVRNRLSSTATAVFAPAQSSPTFSVATVVSRGRKREPIENIL